MKKDSQTIHREHAEQKAVRDKERARAGYKTRKGISLGPSKKQENALSNPFAQLLAGMIRLNRAKQKQSPAKREYKPRKV